MSSKSNKFGSRRDAMSAQRRGVVDSDVERNEEEDAIPSGVPTPSTIGMKVREDVLLTKPVKVVACKSADREQAKEDDRLIIDDDRGSDTEVEDDGNVAMEEEEHGGSDLEPLPKVPRKRGRGRPTINPNHVDQDTGEKLAERAIVKKERKWEEEQEKALNPATAIRKGPRLKKARREELELLLKFKETSAAGLSAIINEQVTTSRRVAQGCSNLKGTTIKALWDTTVSIVAATAALNMRAHSTGKAVAYPEWKDLREELRQLRVDMAHIRATNESLKESFTVLYSPLQ